MPRGRFGFAQDECELVHATDKPTIHSILVEQKCIICEKPTGFGYYSDTGKEKQNKKAKCEKCLNKAMTEACAKDQSHTKRLSI